MHVESGWPAAQLCTVVLVDLSCPSSLPYPASCTAAKLRTAVAAAAGAGWIQPGQPAQLAAGGSSAHARGARAGAPVFAPVKPREATGTGHEPQGAVHGGWCPNACDLSCVLRTACLPTWGGVGGMQEPAWLPTAGLLAHSLDPAPPPPLLCSSAGRLHPWACGSIRR